MVLFWAAPIHSLTQQLLYWTHTMYQAWFKVISKQRKILDQAMYKVSFFLFFKFEDLIDFIRQFMNWAAAYPPSKEMLPSFHFISFFLLLKLITMILLLLLFRSFLNEKNKFQLLIQLSGKPRQYIYNILYFKVLWHI